MYKAIIISILRVPIAQVYLRLFSICLFVGPHTEYIFEPNGFGQSLNEAGLDPRPIRLTDYGFVTGTQSFIAVIGPSDWWILLKWP